MGTGWKQPWEPVFQPIPPNRDQWPRPTPGALGTHWYQLERPTDTEEAATLTQAGSHFGTGWSFQPVPMSFPYFAQIQFCFLFITIYSFIIAKRIRAL